MRADLFVLFAFANAAHQIVLKEAVRSLIIKQLKALAEN